MHVFPLFFATFHILQFCLRACVLDSVPKYISPMANISKILQNQMVSRIVSSSVSFDSIFILIGTFVWRVLRRNIRLFSTAYQSTSSLEIA